MGQKQDFKKLYSIVLKLVLLGTLILSGCSSSFESNKNSNFDARGLPKQKYLVGGGYGITWVAPLDGTVYITEEKISPGRVIMTKSVKSGEEFSSSLSPETIADIFGDVKISDLNFCLYFIPAGEMQVNL